MKLVPPKLKWQRKRLVEKIDTAGRRYCYDDARGAFHRESCPVEGRAAASSDLEEGDDEGGTSVGGRVEKATKTLLAHLADHAKERLQKNLDQVNTSARMQKVTEAHLARMKAHSDQCEVTINFDPSLPIPDKGGAPARMADLLIKDQELRNLFDVGTGQGETNKEIRNGWEARNFGDEVQSLDTRQRPKYGALNWEGRASGPATIYGPGVFVLNRKALQDRITVSADDSALTDMNEVAPLSDPRSALVLNRFIVDATLNEGEPGNAPLAEREAYIECQIWGELPINSETIKEVRLPDLSTDRISENEKKSHRALSRWAKDQGIPVRFYNIDEEDM